MTELERIKNLEVPTGIVDCVLDTDAFNEVDDQYALSLMMKHEKFNVKAIFAAPFFNVNSSSPEDGMEKSYDEILRVLELLDYEKSKDIVYKGSRNYLANEKTPQKSKASEKLCSLAMEYTKEKPLYVVAIGAITNIASAILINPEITERIVVIWLGGHYITWPDTNEFNMSQDIAAARIIFGCGCPLVHLPCMGVVSGFTLSKADMEYWLSGKNKLCDYLAGRAIEDSEKYSSGKPWSRIMWDVTAVGWLLNENDRFMLSRLVPAPVPEYDYLYGYTPYRHLIRQVTYIKRDALMKELIDTLTK